MSSWQTHKENHTDFIKECIYCEKDKADGKPKPTPVAKKVPAPPPWVKKALAGMSNKEIKKRMEEFKKQNNGAENAK